MLSSQSRHRWLCALRGIISLIRSVSGMAQPFHYVYSGLRVASELPLPEWEAFETRGPETADVVIRQLVSAPATPSPPSASFSFEVPGVAYYEVKGGSEICVWPSEGADAREVRLYLLGSAWGALCYQRHLFVVHASAVEVGGQAVLFAAPSGHGKSSLAAWLGTRGYPLVSDDLCRIDLPPEGAPIVHPASRKLKLWEDALQALNWNPRDGVRDHTRHNKFHLPAPKIVECPSLPLGAVYLLGWGPLALQRIEGLDAWRRFMADATYRPSFLEEMGRSGRYAQQCLTLLSLVPFWSLQRPRDLDRFSQTLDLLTRHWSEKELA